MGKEEKCGLCGRCDPPAKASAKKVKKANQVGWICCDKCSVWYHLCCVRISDPLTDDIQSFVFLCEKCAVRGSLIAKQSSSSTGSDLIAQLQKTVQDLSTHILKLQAELDTLRSSSKKQIDRIQCKVNSDEQRDTRYAAQTALINNIEQKLEVIEAGAKLANTCSQSTNCCRLAINKIPFREGENVRNIVADVLNFLDISEAMSSVSKCFRLQVKSSKWSDRTISPTIAVVFDNREMRDNVLKRYFERHKDAKLCRLKGAPALEYRFTINEMLSVQAFRIRNFALRLKQRKIIKSVFVRNDTIAVLLPGKMRYSRVNSTDHLLELTGGTGGRNEDSSVFFDATSADLSASSRC